MYKIQFGNSISNKLDVTLWWGIVLLLALLIFSTALGQALLILLILLGSLKIIKEKKLSFIKNPVFLSYIAFVSIRILSVISSDYPASSIHALNKEIFFYVIPFVFYTTISQYNEDKFLLIIRVLIFAAVIASIIGTSKVLLGFSTRAESTTSGYSTLGLFLSVIIAVVFTLGRNKVLFPSRIWWLIILLIIATGILFTFNRSNWISVMVIILFIGLYRERAALCILFTISAGLIFFVPELSDRFNQLINFTHHLSERDIIWRGALMIWDQHPILGFGPRTFSEIFPLYDQLVDKGVGGWHNEYLQFYMESGFLGLTAFLWLLYSIFYQGIKTLKYYSIHKFKIDLILALLAGMSIFYLNSFSGGFLLDPVCKVLFFFLLAMEVIYIQHGLMMIYPKNLLMNMR